MAKVCLVPAVDADCMTATARRASILGKSLFARVAVQLESDDLSSLQLAAAVARASVRNGCPPHVVLDICSELNLRGTTDTASLEDVFEAAASLGRAAWVAAASQMDVSVPHGLRTPWAAAPPGRVAVATTAAPTTTLGPSVGDLADQPQRADAIRGAAARARKRRRAACASGGEAPLPPPSAAPAPLGGRRGTVEIKAEGRRRPRPVPTASASTSPRRSPSPPPLVPRRPPPPPTYGDRRGLCRPSRFAAAAVAAYSEGGSASGPEEASSPEPGSDCSLMPRASPPGPGVDVVVPLPQ